MLHLKRYLLAIVLTLCLATGGITLKAPAASDTPAETDGGHGNEEAPAHGEEAEDAGHGAEDSGHGGGGGETATAEEEAPTYALGEPLGELFDRSVLRSTRRVKELRYPIEGIEATFGNRRTRTVMLSLCIEFGSETGMAEIQEREAEFREVIGRAIKNFKVSDLVRSEVKYRMKETVAHQLNIRLKTAKIRQVYLTDFRIGPYETM